MNTKIKIFANHKFSRIPQFLSAFLAFLFIFITLVVPVANAADTNEQAEKAAEEFIGDDDFGASFDKAEKENLAARKKGEVNYNSFAYLVKRLISTSYMNNVAYGVPSKGLTSPSDLPVKDHICDINSPLKGTPLYHNCDIPNFMGEAIQTVFELFSPQGISGGAKTQNRLWVPNFGLPSNLPGDGTVPAVITSDTKYKYTGLEVFGYNLRYTSYSGEWDHISVMNQARMLSNFGGSDYIKLAWGAMLNGIEAAFDGAVKGASQGWEDGGLFGAIGGFYTGLVEGATSGIFRTILDSSDLNVVNTDAWYRPVYGPNSYSIREKTEAEQANEIVKEANEYMSSDSAAPAIGDPELAELLGKEPTPAINAEGGEMTYSQWYNDADHPYNKIFVDYWNNHDGVGGDSCPVPTQNPPISDSVEAFRKCAPKVIEELVEKDYKDKQKSSFLDWLKGKQSPAKYREWAIANNSTNFNAPWNKYICIHAESGLPEYDTGGHIINAWNKDGTYNCSSPARIPIQNGLFGSGYITGETMPKPDTRHVAQVGNNMLMQVIGLSEAVDNSSSNLIATSAFFNRISNTALNLAFSPIFKELGVNDIVMSLMESFRDGIFAPLLAMAVSAGAVYVLFQAGTKRNYAEQFKNLLLIVCTSILGVILLYSPEKMLFYTEEVPAMIETTIMGTIFETGRSENSKLCTATGTVSGAKGEDLEGKTLQLDPGAAVRQMMCENWLVFVYSPYVYGQWGTSIENLNAASSDGETKVSNTNESQVGDASVRLGPGSDHVMKNWAVYQTRMMTAGSATTTDRNAEVGKTDSNLYKVVDMQAGPNNGAGTDPKYFSKWNGSDPMGRFLTSFISVGSSAAGMAVVVAYSMKLLELKLITTLMLTIMPFMFIMGVIPGQGRLKLKKYFATLGVLIIQRILLVALLAIMMRILLGLSMAASGFVMLALISTATPIVFLLYKKELLGMVEGAASSVGGVMNTPGGREMLSAAGNAIPLSVKNRLGTERSGLAGGLSGAAAGALAGGIVTEVTLEDGSKEKRLVSGRKAMVAGFKNGRAQHMQFRNNRNRRAGLGAAQRMGRSYAESKESLIRESKRADEARAKAGKSPRIDIEKELNEKVNKERAAKKLPNLPAKTIKYDDVRQLPGADKILNKMLEASRRKSDAEMAIKDLEKEPASPQWAQGNPLIRDPKQVKEIQKLKIKAQKAKEDFDYHSDKIVEMLMKQERYGSQNAAGQSGGSK